MSLLLGRLPVETVVLDFDLTLYHDADADLQRRMWKPARERIMRDLFVHKGNKHPTEQQIEEMNSEYEGLVKDMGLTKAYYQMGGDKKTWDMIAKRNPRAPHLKYDKELYSLLTWMARRAHVIVFTGATRQTVMEALAVLLNGKQDKFFTQVVADDDLGGELEKPDREAYLKMIELAGINPKTSVMVDDQVSEIESAASVGMRGVLVGTKHSEEVRKSVLYHVETVHGLKTLLSSR